MFPSWDIDDIVVCKSWWRGAVSLSTSYFDHKMLLSVVSVHI